jgi:GMP synthase (glutamine-hydrolysing)
MKILIVDNNINPQDWGSKNLCRLARLAKNSTICVRRAPHGDLPSDPRLFDRIIVSGSKTSAMEEAPWIDDLLNFIRKTIDAGIPYLGVCFGHQSLARALGGISTVRKAARAEFGWTEIRVTKSSPLLEGIPKVFHSFSAHFDEVAELPDRLSNLASSKDCAIQACQLEDLPVYGIQFHPEKSIEDGEATLRERKKTLNPPYLLNPGLGQKLYQAEIGETLFKNFLEIKL